MIGCEQAHYGQEQLRIAMYVLGHSLVCLLICLHGSLIRLNHAVRFACVIRYAHSFICLLAHSLTLKLVGKRVI